MLGGEGHESQLSEADARGGGLSQADARGGPRAVNSRASHATSSRELSGRGAPG